MDELPSNLASDPLADARQWLDALLSKGERASGGQPSEEASRQVVRRFRKRKPVGTNGHATSAR